MKTIFFVLAIIAIPLLGQFINIWIHNSFREAVRITIRKIIAILAIFVIAIIVLYFVNHRA